MWDFLQFSRCVLDRWLKRELQLERDEQKESKKKKKREHIMEQSQSASSVPRSGRVSGVCFGPVKVQPDSCGDTRVSVAIIRQSAAGWAAGRRTFEVKWLGAANNWAQAAWRGKMHLARAAPATSPKRHLWKDLDKRVGLLRWQSCSSLQLAARHMKCFLWEETASDSS